MHKHFCCVAGHVPCTASVEGGQRTLRCRSLSEAGSLLFAATSSGLFFFCFWLVEGVDVAWKPLVLETGLEPLIFLPSPPECWCSRMHHLPGLWGIGNMVSCLLGKHAINRSYIGSLGKVTSVCKREPAALRLLPAVPRWY